MFRTYRESFSGLSREVWFLAFITLINRAGTMVIPFLAIYLTDRLGFTYSQVGWIMTAFGIGSLAGAWLGGKLADRFGYYSVMLTSLVGTGMLFIALQWVTGFLPFCLSIFAIMLVADSFRPAGLVALNAYSRPKNRTRSVTLVRLAINLGFSVGPALGGWIIVASGYRGLFWIDGLSCIAAGLLILFLLSPKKIKEHEPEFTSEMTRARSAYSDPPYWLFLAMTFLMGFSFMQLFSTVPLYYREAHGLGENIIGWLLASNGMLIFLTEMPLVHFFERRSSSRLRVVQFACLLIAVSYVLLNISPFFAILPVSMFFITVGEMLGFPFTNAIAMNRAPGRRSGEYLALYTMSFSAAHIVGPNIGMQLADRYGFDVCWYFMAGIALVALLLGRRLETRMPSRSVEVPLAVPVSASTSGKTPD